MEDRVQSISSVFICDHLRRSLRPQRACLCLCPQEPRMPAIVEVRDLHKSFTRGSETIDVLQGLTLDVDAGEFLALMGPSGSGKTTLLNLIAGLDRPTEGTIT